MKTASRQRTRFEYLICIILLASSSLCLTAWTAEDEKTEQESKDAREKRVEEEADIKQRFEYSFNDVSDNLVIIESRTSVGKMAGSGFIARMNGKTYIFTNQHVILGADSIEFKTVTGKHLKPLGVELSHKRDIARLPIADQTDALVISDNLAMGIPLAVFGNSEGSGVATELYGKVNGVGADLVEVSAEFVSGNSGSPVLNLDKEVIGIASYVRYSEPSKMKEGTQFENKVRRFCYRLTDVKWLSVNWRRYNDKYGKPYLVTQNTFESLAGIIAGWYEEPLGRVTSGNYPDISLIGWSTTHNKMVDRVNDIIQKGHLTRTQQSKLRDEIYKSAHNLANIAHRLAVEVEKQAGEKALSGFLREELEGYAYGLEYASQVLDYVGKEVAEYIDNL